MCEKPPYGVAFLLSHLKHIGLTIIVLYGNCHYLILKLLSLMKEEVIDFLRNLPNLSTEVKFNKAFEFYRRTPGASQSQIRVLNVQGYTKDGLDVLVYELKKLHGIKDSEVYGAPSKPTKKEVEATTTDSAPIVETDSSTALKLRDEFPFLNEDSCPNEMKILVADKFTAYNKWKAGHEKLQKIEAGEIEATEEEITALAKETSESFEENQAIYEELNYYKETGKIKGSHDLFEELNIRREVAAMTNEALAKELKNGPAYISKNNANLEKITDKAEIAKIQKRISEREFKLQLVKDRLAANE